MKLLLPMINLTHRQKFLLAGGFQPLTFETFTHLVKITYTHCIVIQEFL